MSSPATKSLIYRGPAQQVCYELSTHGYSPVLVPDAVYELPTEFANALLASNAHFQVAQTAFSFKRSFASSSASATSSEQENQ